MGMDAGERAVRKGGIEAVPKNDRPRERLFAQGAEALGDAELVALVLGHGRVGATVLELARDLLADPDPQRSGLRVLAERDASELTGLAGIGPAKAAAIAAAVEIGRRLAAGDEVRAKLDSPRAVYQVFAARLAGLGHEEMWSLSLDRHQRLLGRDRVGQGGVDYAPAEPAQVFRAAVRRSACGVVVVHNHPTGDPTPSEADRKLTQLLHRAGRFLRIELLDHLIVGDGRYFSFREAGALRREIRNVKGAQA